MSQSQTIPRGSPVRRPYTSWTHRILSGGSRLVPPTITVGAPTVVGVLIALVLTSVGCSRSSGSSQPAPSTQAFAIARTTPQTGAEDVELASPVEVEFTRPVDFDSVTSESFRVRGALSGPVAGFYTRSTESRAVTFLATSPFLSGEQVSVELTEAILSEGAEPLSPFSFEFRVRPEPDDPPDPEEPPEPDELVILSVTPSPNEGNVSPDASIVVEWNLPLSWDTVHDDSVRLVSDVAGRVEAALEATGAEMRGLRIVPSRPFYDGEPLALQLASTLRGAGDETFSGRTFRFKARTSRPAGAGLRQEIFATLGSVKHLAVADLDGDGITDILYASQDETFVDVLMVKPGEKPRLALRIETGQPVQCLKAADVDADGDMDLVVGLADRARVYLHRGLPAGSSSTDPRWDAGPEVVTMAPVHSVAVGDLDHEGSLDFVLDTDAGLQVRLGGIDGAVADGLGSSRKARTHLTLADVDADGWLDILFGHAQQSIVVVGRAVPGGSAPSWFSNVELVSLSRQAGALAVEDLNGDGRLDLVTLGDSNGAAVALEVVWQTAQGFASEGAPAGGGGAEEAVAGPGALALADRDGDGFDDALLALSDRDQVVEIPNAAGDLDPGADPALVAAVPDAEIVMPALLGGAGGADLVVAGGNEIHLLLGIEGDDPVPPEEGTYRVAVEDLQVRQGDDDVSAVVRCTNADPLQGYSIALGFDPTAVAPREIRLTGSVTEAADVEFADFQLLESGDALLYSVIAEILEPFEGKVIPAGEDQVLFRLAFDVWDDAPLGTTTLDFVERAGPPPASTVLVVSSASVTPETVPASIEILPAKEDPEPTSDYVMDLSDTTIEPGATGEILVKGSMIQPIDAFTTVVAFDPAIFEVIEFLLTDTVTEAKGAEMVIPTIDNTQGYAVLTVILDFLPPLDRQKIEAGDDQLLCRIQLRAKDGALPGEYPVRLDERFGPQELESIFVAEGAVSIAPEKISATVTVGDGASQVEFVRGNADGDSIVSLNDAIFLANYLFQGATEPECLDAADVDDDGVVILTDAIFLLNHLFQGGPEPPPPYPMSGPDPTPDTISCAASPSP